jgi:hypothetical protein
MNRKLLSILFVPFLFAVSTFAQITQENLLDKVELRFSLNGEPNPVDVGFDNLKSSWKLRYELYLTDFAELKKIGRCIKGENGLHWCPLKYDKKLDKKIRKSSTTISKGSFTRKSLSNEANREVIVPINLQPDIIEIFNQATKVPDKNPTFVLFVTTKASTKNSAKAKFKKKYSINGVNPLKHAASNETSEYWNVRNLSLNLTITKGENGQLKGFNSLIH